MAITNKLQFTKPQLRQFAQLFRQARLKLGLTQLQVAQAAFEYQVSHCKVSRVERCAMLKVDAYAILRMAQVLGVPKAVLSRIDPVFKRRLNVVLTASAQGFWAHTAK